MRFWHTFWITYHNWRVRRWKQGWHHHQCRAWEHDLALNPREAADLVKEVGSFDA